MQTKGDSINIVTSPSKRTSPTKRTKLTEEIMPLERRLSMLSKDPKVSQQDLKDYKDTEIIRKSVNDVKLRAAAEATRRQSPSKTYSGVKSKIAGNMKSQKKAKKTEKQIAMNQYIQQQVVAGNLEVLDDGVPVNLKVKTASPSKTSYTVKYSASARVADLSPERTQQIERKQRELEEMQDELTKLKQTRHE